MIMALCALIVPAAQAKTLRVGSYNLRMHQIDKGDNAWGVRRERLKQSIAENKFDVCGLQEVSSKVQKEMDELTGGQYGSLFFSPYHLDGKGNKACGLIYLKSRLELIESHFFWPSDTPDTVSINDPYVWKDGRKSKFSRGALCATFKDRRSGKRIFFMVTHGCLNQETNALFAQVYIDREKMYNPEGLPSFFVGDFNTRPDTPASELYRTYWTDCLLGAKKVEGPENTFNGFHLGKAPDRRIDFVYAKGKIKIRKYACNDKLYGGLYASDHFPIWADIVLK